MAISDTNLEVAYHHSFSSLVKLHSTAISRISRCLGRNWTNTDPDNLRASQIYHNRNLGSRESIVKSHDPTVKEDHRWDYYNMHHLSTARQLPHIKNLLDSNMVASILCMIKDAYQWITDSMRGDS